MKNLIQYVTVVMSVILLQACSFNVSSDVKEASDENLTSMATDSFKVWGNCGMCKETIEGSLKIPGISRSEWNSETKKIVINYDSTKVNMDQIQKSIASVGYDTENYRGNDSAYANLHECCQYERKNP
jgi:mercuric ion binding protein